MKNNQPVTQVEYPFPRGQTLVSRTDLKGVITFANDAFVEASGFTRDELIGRAHNTVRHPDMPPAAFADLWTEINAGRPWQGMVKNRRKNGDHYWVKALVVPVRHNNQTIGHMSVRTEPTRAEVADAERLYAAIRAGQARMRRHSPLDWMFRLSFNARYVLFVLWMTLLCAAAGAAGLGGQQALAIGLGVMALVSAAGSYLFMASTVSAPLVEAAAYFDQIAQGRLDNAIPVNRPDEVGRVLAGLAIAQTHLRVMIDEIRLSSDEVERRCGELESQTRRVAGLCRDQTQQVARVSAAMGGLAASITEVAQTAESSADSARQTLDVVTDGAQRMARSIDATDQVARTVQGSGENITALSQSIDKISGMTAIVKEIADQTNLLALNAAIEAARAGEQGRGFAVVADEVRKLAERTTTTTGEIDRMVVDIQATAHGTTSTMEAASHQVQDGRALIEQTNDSFHRITHLSRDVTEISNSIAAAARDQSLATEDVARTMEDVARLIGENDTSFAAVGSAVAELRQTAAKLRGVVQHFGDSA